MSEIVWDFQFSSEFKIRKNLIEFIRFSHFQSSSEFKITSPQMLPMAEPVLSILF